MSSVWPVLSSLRIFGNSFRAASTADGSTLLASEATAATRTALSAPSLRLRASSRTASRPPVACSTTGARACVSLVATSRLPSRLKSAKPTVASACCKALVTAGCDMQQARRAADGAGAQDGLQDFNVAGSQKQALWLAAPTLEGKDLKPGEPVKAFCIEIRVEPRYLTPPARSCARSGFVLARQAA